MARRAVRATVLALLLAMFLGVVLARGPVTVYEVHLQCTQQAAGYDIQCSIDPMARGTASATAWVADGVLTIEGEYRALGSPVAAEPALGMHLHHDPALYHLNTFMAALENDGGTHGVFQASVDVTSQTATMLDEGRLYLDIHTAAFPEGAMRGMLVPLYVHEWELY